MSAAAVVAIAAVLLTGGGSHRGRASSTGQAPAPPPAAAPTPLGAPAKPPPGSEQFGVNVNRLFNDRSYTPSQIDSQLNALSATSATVARSDALWEAAEPSAPLGGVHHYDWSFDDLIAGSLAAHGLRWIAILDYSAPWAQSIPGQDHSPPSSASDFGAFAAAFAARYGSGGSFWREHPALAPEAVGTYEIWNEPDNAEFWLPAPDPARYVELYLRARDAIEAVDPAARVIVGGLTNPSAFLPAMLSARPDLAGHIDGVAIHPYGANPSVVLARVRFARRALSSLGLSTVPLYVSEFGWTTSPAGALSWAPEAVRPRYVSSTLAALGHSDCAVAATLLYTWVTPERDPANHEDWFGVHPPAGGTSPDNEAFAAGVREAARPGATVRVCG
jgi:hypothetical protein